MHEAVAARSASIPGVPATIEVSRSTPRAGRFLFPLTAALLGVVMTAGLVAAGQWWWRTHVDPGPQPQVAGRDLLRDVADLTPLTITVGGSLNAPWQTTVDDVRRNHALWRMMHLENWNTVPSPLREEALEQILTRYRPLLMNPRVWDQMTAADWDNVPQPVRTIAFRQMASYWGGFYDVGGRYGISRRDVRDTLEAIVMSESWFDHRAERTDWTGNRDIGLVQASDYARDRVRQLAARGDVDVALTDEDYWNPWKATRFLSLWMSLLVEESNGDLDRAVRAYNRGIANADDVQGRAYQAAVDRRRRRFIQNLDAPPAWTWIWNRARDIEADEWPWLHSH